MEILQGDIFWPNLVDNNLIVYNTSLPNSHEVGILNLNDNSVHVVYTPTSSYLMGIRKFDADSLLKTTYPDVVYGYGSDPQLKDRTNIFGLEKINTKTFEVQAYPIPSAMHLSNSAVRIQYVDSCDDSTVELGVIEGNVSGNEKYTAFYTFNLKSGETKPIPYTRGTSIPSCKSTHHSEEDYEKVFPTGFISKCLTVGVKEEKVIEKKDIAYLYLEPGFGSCDVLNKKQGLYRINLTDRSYLKVSSDKDVDENDFIIVAEE